MNFQQTYNRLDPLDPFNLFKEFQRSKEQSEIKGSKRVKKNKIPPPIFALLGTLSFQVGLLQTLEPLPCQVAQIFLPEEVHHGNIQKK
jgi:hypothetical protein